jgi:hypothetical protein
MTLVVAVSAGGGVKTMATEVPQSTAANGLARAPFVDKVCYEQ